ncbi:MAG TPA: ATP-binding protein [Gammaproteobacteria bacterium]|jgi:signal transduction histidine kinase
MKRRLVATGLAVMALALLAALVLQSRPMPVETHLVHHAALAELDRAVEDLYTLIAALESARAEDQTLGEGTEAVLSRLEASPVTISQQLSQVRGATLQETRVQNRLAGYVSSVADTTRLIRELIDAQAGYVEQLDLLRDSGPGVVQRLREIRLDEAADTTFQLVVGALDFTGVGSAASGYDLRQLQNDLRRDRSVAANLPGEVRTLLDAVDAILSGKPAIESRLDQIAESSVATAAGNLITAAEDIYTSTLASVSQARTLLSVFAMLLLAAAGFIALRLSQSYQVLNRVNSELEELNTSLERRVHERTEELENALKEIQNSQAQLVQAEKMSSLGQLVAGISHEINTPLLYLANNAVLIQERLELLHDFVQRCAGAFSLKPDDFEDRKAFQIALANALKSLKARIIDEELLASIEEATDLLSDSISGLNDLTEMAQGLKDFSRLDRAPIENFNVNTGLDRSLLIARNAIKYKAEVTKDYGELPDIECAPSQLNQVFLNLLTNAAQAIDDHGEILISTKCYGDSHVSIRIADTGCGIPEEHLDRIRDPFFTTKEVGTGTGLGLSIVDKIIRAHGGELFVESEVGKGSAFTVVLPIRQARPGELSGDERGSPAPTGHAAETREKIAAAV